MYNTGRLARIKDIRKHLATDGYVKFVWVNNQAILIHARHVTFCPIDGRSYQAFLLTADQKYNRTETGSTETNDLVIEWRNKA